jgi:phosphonate transport system substrate-binding protein
VIRAAYVQIWRIWVLAAGAVALLAIACGSGEGTGERTLYIGGIPDQDVSLLEARFDGLADYLSRETGLDVRYLPSFDYAAVVTGFRNDDIQLAWYGGLTGVQARLAVPDAEAIAQRPRDAEFHSVFIKRKGLDISSLAELRGHTFTFGSESSTSGYLMPLFFIGEAGVDLDDLKSFSFSGSHDTTWKLVEAGSFDAGALNAAVWEQRVADGKVDLGRVEVFFNTPAYVDYHWVARGDLDFNYGVGTTEKLRQALLGLGDDGDPVEAEILAAFQDEGFVPTRNENYEAIERMAKELGIIE